jgi:cobalt-zinc-cadmium efflux system protein
MDKVKKVADKIKGVSNLHHIHVWAISTTENALTAHLVLNTNTSMEEEQHIKADLRHRLLHLNIQHVTLETEREFEACAATTCEAEKV